MFRGYCTVSVASFSHVESRCQWWSTSPNQPLAVTVTLGRSGFQRRGELDLVGMTSVTALKAAFESSYHVRLHRRDLDSLPYTPVLYCTVLYVCFRASMVSCRSRRLISQRGNPRPVAFSMCLFPSAVKQKEGVGVSGSAWFSLSSVLSHL